MKLSHIFRRPSVPAFPVPPSLRTAYAYACLDCERISEGANSLRCKVCGSQSIFHVLTLLDQVKNRAAQRIKMQETLRAAKLRGERNDLAFLTSPEPKDAA